MTETEFDSLEYLSWVFKGLDAEKKDCVLNAARSLLKIQGDSNYPVNNKTVSHSRKEEDTFLENMSVYADKKRRS